MTRRVLKLGGSLLDMPGLRQRLQSWLERQPPAANIVIVGGGRLADVIRDADRMHDLGDEAAHRLAVETLGVTAELAAELLGAPGVVANLAALTALDDGALRVFDPRQFLANEDARHAQPLPHHWDVTSDSIAARVATALQAAELVLLKSALPPQHASLGDLAAGGYVDRWFPRVAGELSVRAVNLRAAACEEVQLSRCRVAAS